MKPQKNSPQAIRLILGEYKKLVTAMSKYGMATTLPEMPRNLAYIEALRQSEGERGDLPPDPEEMNDNRALWAQAALDAFIEETGTEPEDAVSDLLCDLMHWCDRNEQEFDWELDRAATHYREETEEFEIEEEVA